MEEEHFRCKDLAGSAGFTPWRPGTAWGAFRMAGLESNAALQNILAIGDVTALHGVMLQCSKAVGPDAER
jgi:hypothetical protein